ncbi:glutathione S-transferase T3-like protein [Tanacetum coccineum]
MEHYQNFFTNLLNSPNIPQTNQQTQALGFAQFQHPQQTTPPSGNTDHDTPTLPSLFPSQNSVENIDLDTPTSNKTKGKKGELWSQGEEELLMSAWVTISTDNVTGNAQQGKDYWRRITNYYNDYRKSFPPRTQPKVKAHWMLQENCITPHTKAFKYEHAWVVVKDEPKWNAGSTNEDQTKRRKTTASGSYTSSSDGQTSINIEDEETQVRPMGKKQAARKQKGKGTTSSVEVNDGLRDLINKQNTDAGWLDR